ncbi:flagellar basal body rod protein FlgB [Ferrimonas marina]|uniref:Flagellar basal body rod protein FlgB n=1 Tax=Ferrimonas marina TaxID=299255 RepID=A0A1M5TFW6_9GAMM|nr:flagellar basal body rod protein FlgB [Ferrimonas marina]SHH49589.1 flagellar basal-body rod protein FlgB [Ferrimonas marina]
MFETVLGPYSVALEAREAQLSVIAGNIANADTPHYQAQSIDFEAAMSRADASAPLRMTTTHSGHLDPTAHGRFNVEYQRPSTGSADGNTVDIHRETTEHAKAVTGYNLALELLQGSSQGLRKAIKGQ